MKSSRLVFQLEVSGLTTDEYGYSLLPTPSGTSNGGKNHVVGRLDEWGGSSNPWRKIDDVEGLDNGATVLVYEDIVASKRFEIGWYSEKSNTIRVSSAYGCTTRAELRNFTHYMQITEVPE